MKDVGKMYTWMGVNSERSMSCENIDILDLARAESETTKYIRFNIPILCKRATNTNAL